MPRLLERTRDARRRQILDAARRCFTRGGFEATSMQDIFTEAGLSAGAVYCHFSGRDEIITAIVDEVIDEIISAFDVSVDDDDPPTLDDVFQHFFDTLERADLARIAIAVWAEAVRDPALRRSLSARYRRMRENVTRLVQLHQNHGTIDPEVPARQVVHVLTALGPAFLHQRALENVTAATFSNGLRALLQRRDPQIEHARKTGLSPPARSRSL
jgi:AcrR family transcriptional regulator